MRRCALAHEVVAEEVPESGFEAWSRLVSESPEGSVFSLPEYLEMLCKAGGGYFRVIAARAGDELVGGVALYERSSRLGARVAPRLLLYYNGVVLRRWATKYPSEQTARGLKVMSALAEAIARRGYGRVSLRCRSTVRDVRPFLAAGWSARPGYTYVVPIADLERARSRLEQNLRRLVKRCEGQGMAFTDDDDFAAFHALHVRTTERKHLEQYLPEAAFRAFFEALRAAKLCRLFHAREPGGRAVASQLVLLGPGSVAHTVVAAGDLEAMRAGATAFLRWRGFEALSALGFAAVDLTDAALNPVTHFKSQLGGDLETVMELEAPRPWRVRAVDRLRSLVRGGRG